MKKKLLSFLFFAGVIGILVFQVVQYYRMFKALTSMAPQDVTVLRIYPRSGRPRGKSVIFRTPDPLIDEFFRSLSDIRIYWPNHDTVASQDHSWFLEVSTGGDPIQIHFHIPSGKGARVAGEFGNWNLRSSVHYGDFQSQQLYDWYQKYSHRWLSPPAEQEEEGEKVRK